MSTVYTCKKQASFLSTENDESAAFLLPHIYSIQLSFCFQWKDSPLATFGLSYKVLRRASGCGSVVEPLPGMCEALGLNQAYFLPIQT